VTQIPPHLKQKGRVGKYIFKKAMEPYLPYEAIYHPKTGFGVPLRRGVHNDLCEVIMEVLCERNLKKRRLFKPTAVKKLIDDNYSGRVNATCTIFSLLCIEW
jgi:asparagine synthase (glutamine-hydrolysing)